MYIFIGAPSQGDFTGHPADRSDLQSFSLPVGSLGTCVHLDPQLLCSIWNLEWPSQPRPALAQKAQELRSVLQWCWYRYLRELSALQSNGAVNVSGCDIWHVKLTSNLNLDIEASWMVMIPIGEYHPQSRKPTELQAATPHQDTMPGKVI